MKKVIRFLLIGILLVGCDKIFDQKEQDGKDDESSEFEMTSSDFSGCKGLKSVSITDSTDLIIVSSLSDGNYLIKHYNASFNCCLPEGIAIEASLSNDTLYFLEYEKVPGNCRCMCSYDVSAGVSNLDEGEYVLCIIKDNNILGSTTLLFEEGMKEEFYVSELTY